MGISICIQHHPRRADLLTGLLSALTPAKVQVIRDPDPSGPAGPWRTYRRALETTPAWASHRVILQDDVTLCRSFFSTLERALAARPDQLVALCVCARPRISARRIHSAAHDGRSWAVLDISRFVPVIALAWPAELIAPALEWVDQQTWPREFTADDEIVGRAARALRLEVLATVPSLVQHEDMVPSLIGRRVLAGGRDPGRVAALFVAGNADPAAIDWTA